MRVYQFRHAGIVGTPKRGRRSYLSIGYGASIIPARLAKRGHMG